MNKEKYSVVCIILKILRYAVVIGFIAITLMTLRNGHQFGSLPLGGLILIRGIAALILFIALLVPGIILKKKLRALVPPDDSVKTRKRHIGLKAVIAAVSVIVTAFLFVLFGQDYILFIPQRGEGAEQLLEEDPHCQRKIYNTDSNTYVGWLWSPENSDDSVVIYFGGNAQISAYSVREWITSNSEDMFGGHKVIYIDYPGYGESSGKPSEKAIFNMVDTVMPKLISEYKKVYVMGFSVGTGAAVYAAANYDTEALILNAPYDNMTNIYNDNLNIFHGPLKKLVHNRFTSDVYARSVTEPVLIIASEDDKVINFCHSRRLSKCFDNAEFIAIKGAGHNDIIYLDETKEAIKKFLSC